MNQYIVTVFKDYYKFAGIKERKFDIFMPFIISIVLVLTTFFLIQNPSDILSMLKDLNNVSLNVISILAGFNTASLSLIAASNFNTLGKMFGSGRSVKNDNSANLLKQTVSFFGYAIMMQLFLLILGAVFIMVFNSLTPVIKNHPYRYWNLSFYIALSVFAITWIAAIFHTLFVSIRNITILYNYVLLIGKEAYDQNKQNGDDSSY